MKIYSHRLLSKTADRGQSIIELAVSLPLFVTAIIFTLHLFIKLILTVAIDDTLESYLLCRTNAEITQAQCRERMTDKVEALSLDVESIQERTTVGLDIVELRRVHIQLSHSVLDPINRTRESRKNLKY